MKPPHGPGGSSESGVAAGSQPFTTHGAEPSGVGWVAPPGQSGRLSLP